MSKLERQLDEIRGDARVEVQWPFTEQMYVEQLRERLRAEIDAHQRRVPLDLRGVCGAPQPVIDLIYELQDYAEAQEKQLVVTHALEAMRSALDPNYRRSSAEQEDEPDASQVAGSILKENLQTIQSFHLAQETAPQSRRRNNSVRRRLKHLASLAALVMVGTFVVVVVEWYVVGYLDDHFRFSAPEPPRKGFEGSE